MHWELRGLRDAAILCVGWSCLALFPPRGEPGARPIGMAFVEGTTSDLDLDMILTRSLDTVPRSVSWSRVSLCHCPSPTEIAC